LDPSGSDPAVPAPPTRRQQSARRAESRAGALVPVCKGERCGTLGEAPADVSERADRRPVGAAGPAVAPSAAWGPAPHGGSPGGGARPPVSAAGGRPLAGGAPRPAPVGHGP